MGVPNSALPHTVWIAPRVITGFGPTTGDPVQMRAMVTEKTRNVPGPSGWVREHVVEVLVKPVTVTAGSALYVGTTTGRELTVREVVPVPGRNGQPALVKLVCT